MKREVELIKDTEFDVVVIGGGIQGAGIAREACLQGLKTLLVDRSDFASGTSSRSTKLIHGGLRYLEHGRLKLVKESLKERKLAMRLAPHLVKPLPFLFPVYSGDRRPLWQIKTGIALYDLLAKQAKIKSHENWDSKKIAQAFPNIKTQGLKGGSLYWDAQTDDSRLCLEVLKAAFQMGAQVANYMRVTGFTKQEGKLTQAHLKDLRSGEEIRVRGKVFINAAGVWCDAVRKMSQEGLANKIVMSKGIHLVTKRLFSPESTSIPLAVVAPTRDKRVFFIIPWLGETSLIGTTDTEFTGKPSECYAEKEDVEYLLGEFRRIFPDYELKRENVYTTFTGLRALVGTPGKVSAELSREYEIETLENGLISVLGGKYTTFRSLSEKIVAQALKQLGQEARYEDTSLLSLNGLIQEDEGDLRRKVDLERRSQFYKLTEREREHLWLNYGIHTLEIFKLLDYDPDLKEGVKPDCFPMKAEIVYAIKDEMILTLTDFFRRRSQLFFSPNGGLNLLDAVANVYQDYLHWSDEEIERQKQAYRQEVERNNQVLKKISFKNPNSE